MNDFNHQGPLLATVKLAQGVQVSLQDPRLESLELFEGVSRAQRPSIAADVWKIGLRALHSAQASAQAGRLEEIGGELIEKLRAELREHVELQGKQVEERLRHYFDPTSGELTARLNALFADDGSLSRLLTASTGPTSSFAETLESKIGPLMRSLDPEHSEGVIQMLATKVESILADNQKTIGEALDPMVESSAAGRFSTALGRQLKVAGDDQKQRLAAITAALDANNKDSLLSRLLRESQVSQRSLLAAISPTGPGSLLGPLEATISRLLEGQQKRQSEHWSEMRRSMAVLNQEVRETVQRLEKEREQQRSGVVGGLNFEDAVFQFASERLGGSGQLLVDATGTTLSPSGRKVGDVVLTFTEESAFAGVRVVIEAKRKGAMSVKKALDELDDARSNREAETGLFVLSRNVAPEAFPRFVRYGQRVLVVWDADDPATDPWLYAALMLVVALASRAKSGEQGADEGAELDRSLMMIEGTLKRMVEIDRRARTIIKAAEAMLVEVEKGKEDLNVALAATRLVFDQVRRGQADETLESKSPISTAILQGKPPRAKA